MATCWLLHAPITVLAAPTPTAAKATTHRVVVLGDAAPAEAIDEMMVHVQRHFPAAQLLRASSAEAAAFAMTGATPTALVVPGRGAASAAVMQAKRGEKVLWLSVPEHAGPLPSPASPEALVSGILDGCSLPALVRLVGRLSPQARRVGWLLPDGTTASGAVAATLAAEADGVSLSLEGPVPAADVQALSKRVDALLLPWAPEDLTATRAIVQGARDAAIPLYTCDDASVRAGATAGLITDPQQVGEAAGNAVIALLEGRAGREQIESGLIALNLESTCALGLSAPPGLLSKAVLHEEGYVCPARPAPVDPAPAVATPARRRAPWSLGLLGAGLTMLVGVAASEVTRAKR